MRCLIILMIILINMNIYGQVPENNDIPTDLINKLDKMGGSSPLLNCYESAFLNSIFIDTLTCFDFTNKKVGFIEGVGKRSKTDYFNMHKKHLADEKNPLDNGSLYIFNETQKNESGGYDAAIVYWSKIHLPINKVIIKLQNKKQ